jgi:hypothetical protein
MKRLGVAAWLCCPRCCLAGSPLLRTLPGHLPPWRMWKSNRLECVDNHARKPDFITGLDTAFALASAAVTDIGVCPAIAHRGESTASAVMATGVGTRPLHSGRRSGGWRRGIVSRGTDKPAVAPALAEAATSSALSALRFPSTWCTHRAPGISRVMAAQYAAHRPVVCMNRELPQSPTSRIIGGCPSSNRSFRQGRRVKG